MGRGEDFERHSRRAQGTKCVYLEDKRGSFLPNFVQREKVSVGTGKANGR